MGMKLFIGSLMVMAVMAAGFAWYFKNTQARILPIITTGLFNIKPKNRWTIKPGIITIRICDPINIKNKEVNQLLVETQQVFLNHYK